MENPSSDHSTEEDDFSDPQETDSNLKASQNEDGLNSEQGAKLAWLIEKLRSNPGLIADMVQKLREEPLGVSVCEPSSNVTSNSSVMTMATASAKCISKSSCSSVFQLHHAAVLLLC